MKGKKTYLILLLHSQHLRYRSWDQRDWRLIFDVEVLFVRFVPSKGEKISSSDPNISSMPVELRS